MSTGQAGRQPQVREDRELWGRRQKDPGQSAEGESRGTGAAGHRAGAGASGRRQQQERWGEDQAQDRGCPRRACVAKRPTC